MPNSKFPNRGRSFAIAILSALALAAPGWASDAEAWSVRLKIGQASVDEEFDSDVLGWRVDDDADSAGLAIRLTPSRYVGFELGYHDLGSYAGLPRPCEACIQENGILVVVHPESVDFTGVSLALVRAWEITDWLEISGKLGLLEWRGDVTPFYSFQSIDDPSGTDLLAGVDAHFRIARGLGIQLEYEATDFHDNLSLSASWVF